MGKGSRMRRERQQEQAEFHLTPAQRKAMNREITAQVLERDRQYWLDMDAAVMWALHVEFRFGKKRLRRFFERFAAIHEELREFYQLDDDTNTWLCRYRLKEKADVDVETWEKEYEKQHEQ